MITKTDNMLPKLSPAQRAALEDFAWLKLNIADLTRSLKGAITINISGGTVHVHEDIDPFDKVPFTWMHVENALALKREGQVSTEQLSRWAKVVLGVGAYDLEEERQEELAEWLWGLAYDIPATE